MRKRFAFPGPLVIPPAASHILDLMRVLAALVVMVSHLRALFFVDFASSVNKSAPVKAFYLLTGLGHEAVVVFFVLSGLLIGMSVFRVHARDGWSWSDYLLQRLSRLWVVLIPALFLTMLWDKTGIHLFGPHSVYKGLPFDKGILGFDTTKQLGLSTFLGNVFFLQPIWVPAYGTNGPLWSLAFEFWYYLAFPCLLRLFVAPTLKSRILHAVALVAIGFISGPFISISFILWLMGVAILFMPKLWKDYRPASPFWAVLGGIFLVIALVASAVKNSNLITSPMNYVIGLSCMMLIYFLFRLPASNPATHADLKSKAETHPTVIKKMADFSFSLYVLHLPPLVFVHAWLWSHHIGKWQITPRYLALAAGLAVVVILYAFFVSLVTEVHTDKVRRWVKKQFFTPRAATSAR